MTVEATILLLIVYLRPWGSADFCVPFSLVRTHDSHRGTRLDCRGECGRSSGCCSVSPSGSSSVGSGIVMKENDTTR